MFLIYPLSICTLINSYISSSADMSFAERQKAKYAACQKALNSVQPNPPATVLRGSSSEVSDVPKPPTVVSQRAGSTQQKRSVEVEQSHCTKDTRSKCYRTKEPSKDKHSDQGNIEQKTRMRSGEDDCSQDKGKEPIERDSVVKTSANRTPSWHREGFRLLVT